MIDTLLAMDPLVILAFLSAGILLNLTPGSDVIFASASGMAGGWRSGVAAAAGISMGALVHAVLAAVGVSAAVMTLPWAYDAIRYAGAAYLIYLAIRAWQATGETHTAGGAAPLGQALKRGFLTNLMNPKVALFILAFLPQFTRLEAGPIWHQILILGLIFAITGFVITALYGAAAGVFGTALRKSAGFLNKLSSLVFGGLAARLILD